MALYNDPAQHAANPPATWQVRKATARLWHVVDAAGTTLESAPTKREAERLRLEGFCARLWEKERRWYAGEPVAGWRPYRDVTQDGDDRRAEMFAAKWLADTEGEGNQGQVWPTTDANLAQVFAGCVKPPDQRLYPAIRAKLADRSWLVT
jgi:hypothetical protein